MPYTPSDAERFTRKATTSKKRRQWSHVYDDVIKRGGSEASAITQANGVIKRGGTERPAARKQTRTKRPTRRRA